MSSHFSKAATEGSSTDLQRSPVAGAGQHLGSWWYLNRSLYKPLTCSARASTVHCLFTTTLKTLKTVSLTTTLTLNWCGEGCSRPTMEFGKAETKSCIQLSSSDSED